MRREFPAKVKESAWERARGHCETCTAELSEGNINYDHVIPDAMGGEPTLENCAVLCRACHGKKTQIADVPGIAKSKRVRRRHIGIKKQRTIRAWRKFDGSIVRGN